MKIRGTYYNKLFLFYAYKPCDKLKFCHIRMMVLKREVMMKGDDIDKIK